MASQSTSGPWRPTDWSLGGIPKKNVDIPITAVFLLLYMAGAATHMTIFQYNKRRGHKFLFNGMLFGFCMARTTTCILRIATVSLPSNTRLLIAASIFVAAGIVLVFVINLIWAQRILRAHHPLGWHPFVRRLFTALYVLIVLTLAVVITAVVQTFYTLRPRTRAIDRSLQLYGQTLFAAVAFAPIPIVALACALSRATKVPLDTFGAGTHRTKLAVLLAGSALCALGAAFRAATSWRHPVPLTQPQPAYFHKAWFYVMNFGVEVVIVYMYAAMRVDLRFWVPDGARGFGSYGKGVEVGEVGLGSGAGSVAQSTDRLEREKEEEEVV